MKFKLSRIKKIIQVCGVLFLFLVSLKLMGTGFKALGSDFTKDIIGITSNPFLSLFVGLLCTALIQSSSSSTSLIVTMVAAGALPLESAVFMIMGANIGTSVTSTIVALGHITDKGSYAKAIGAATVHDFFNLIVVCLLFPLEYFTGLLSTLGAGVASVLYSADSNVESTFNIMAYTVKPVAKYISSSITNPWFTIALSLVLLMYSLYRLSKLLKKLIIGKSEKRIQHYIFGNPAKSLFWGWALTAAVQSSSITSSLSVPLVATGKTTLRKIFPFLMGANIGTTITALIAALTQSEVALAIALCHVFFNLIGVLILFPIPSLRNFPIFLAEKLGEMAERHRAVGIAYIAVVFFLLPFGLIYMSDDFKKSDIIPSTNIEAEVKP